MRLLMALRRSVFRIDKGSLFKTFGNLNAGVQIGGKMLGLTFSAKLDWVSYIISITKTASKKIGALIHSMTFLSPDIALHLYKSTIRPLMECCCHVWAGAPSCYLELSDKLQKRIFRIVGPSLASSLIQIQIQQDIESAKK